MPRSTVNDAFDEIFENEESQPKPQETTNQNNSNSGFFLNENDIKFVNNLSSKKAELMTKIINTEAVKQTVVNIGLAPSDEEILIVDAILDEVQKQSNLFSEQLGDDSFKNFLSGNYQSLQLTGCQTN
jgi:RNA processing factor Prp31